MTSPRDSKRSALTLAIAALLAIVGWRSWQATASDDVGEAALTPTVESELESPSQNDFLNEARAPANATDERTAHVAAPRSLLCLADADDSPLAEVYAYQRGAQLAGPSDEFGQLKLAASLSGRIVLWRAGSVPLTLRCEALPVQARLVAANCALELALTEMTQQHKVVRSTLLRRGVSLGAGPWTPQLEPGALDVYGAEALPPGTYDVFFWIKEGRQAARAHEVRDVELLAGERKRLVYSRLDASSEDDDS